MKKLALLATLLATLGICQAGDSVSVYGIMDGGISATKAVGSTTTTTSFTSGGMTTSAFGIKGSEDLGGGLNAFFDVSSFIDLGDGAVKGGAAQQNMFTRSAFVGLSDKTLGSVRMGRQEAPSLLPTILFNAYGDSSTYSPLWHATYFGGNNPPSTAIYNDTGWDSAVSYSTPSISGLTVSAVGSHNTTNGGTNSGGNALYFNGAFAATAYYQRTEINSQGSFQTNVFTNAKPADAYGVGASYDAKVAKVYATFQDAKDNSQAMDAKTYQVSTAVPVGRGSALAEYANTKYNTATTYAETVVGYDLPLSKKTDVYANFGRFTQTAQTNGTIYGAGLRVRF
jgi:predicted porin